MAKNKFSLDFDGFLDYANQLDQLGADCLKQATENALNASKIYINNAILHAMDVSPYSFDKSKKNYKGESYSTGQAKKSLKEVANMPNKWEGTALSVYAGVSWYDAPEVSLLAYGTPHIKADNNLKNAIKVKGKYRKEMSQIQQQEFIKVIQEGANND